MTSMLQATLMDFVPVSPPWGSPYALWVLMPKNTRRICTADMACSK